MESAMAAPTEDTVVFLLMVATDAPTEDMVATDVATTARGRLRLLLRLRLPTDTDFHTATATESAMAAPTEDTMVFLLMVATDAHMEDMVATDVATTARGRLRLPLRLRLLTDTAMVAAMEAMEATAAPMEDMVATGPMAAMVALMGMATENRQQLEHRHHMKNLKLLSMNWTKYKLFCVIRSIKKHLPAEGYHQVLLNERLGWDQKSAPPRKSKNNP